MLWGKGDVEVNLTRWGSLNHDSRASDRDCKGFLQIQLHFTSASARDWQVAASERGRTREGRMRLIMKQYNLQGMSIDSKNAKAHYGPHWASESRFLEVCTALDILGQCPGSLPQEHILIFDTECFAHQFHLMVWGFLVMFDIIKL